MFVFAWTFVFINLIINKISPLLTLSLFLWYNMYLFWCLFWCIFIFLDFHLTKTDYVNHSIKTNIKSYLGLYHRFKSMQAHWCISRNMYEFWRKYIKSSRKRKSKSRAKNSPRRNENLIWRYFVQVILISCKPTNNSLSFYIVSILRYAYMCVNTLASIWLC